MGVHLDDAEVHRCRVVLDEIFGIDNFIAEVIWEKADSPNNSAQFLSIDQDTILVYARGRWTVGLAVANTVVGVLFAAAVVWLASADRLVNPAFLEVTGGDSVTWLSNAIVAGTLVITGWDVVSVWVKALRSPRA